MERLPNIFESYYQPENKLTFAFLQTLSVDCQLAQAFLRWVVPKLPVARGPIPIYAQRKPAVGRGFRADDPEVDPTVPDGWLRAFETLVALEVKRDPGLLRGSQLRGHLKALARRDARHKALLILTPDREEPADVVGIAGDARDCGITLCWKPWQAVHSWACDQIASGRAGEQAKGSFLLRSLREYLEMSELSAFAGFVFDQGYDYRRARALLVALRQELSEDVGRLYPELNHGKEKLAGQEESAWDVFAKAKNFTLDPHFTLVISENGPQFCLTVPDKARSAWNRLSGLARERTVLESALKGFLRKALQVPAANRPSVQLGLVQRHWPSISEDPIVDGHLAARLDTASICPSSLRGRGVRRQDSWYEAVLALLAGGKKQANWEFQIRTHFETKQRITARPEFKNEVVRLLEAFKPLYELIGTPR